MTKTISVSLSEALEWKLSELEKRTGISRSGLIQRGLLLLISELDAYEFPGGIVGKDTTEEDIKREYAGRG